MNIAIIGRTQMLYDAAQLLRRQGHAIRAVATAPAAPEYSRTADDFRALAQTVGCPFHLGHDLTSFLSNLEGIDIGISINWTGIIGQNVLSLFKLGILNCHTGDLPAYRGNACPNWAIINGEDRIGMSVHFMEPDALDCGRVVAQDHLALDEGSCIGDVYTWMEERQPHLVAEAVSKLEQNNEYVLKTTTADQGFRCYPRRESDGLINWQDDAKVIDRLIRASGPPFAGAYCYVEQPDGIKKLIILKARRSTMPEKDLAVPGQLISTDAGNGEATIACGKGAIALQRCAWHGSDTPFSPGYEWKGVGLRLGMNIDDVVWNILNPFPKRA